MVCHCSWLANDPSVPPEKKYTSSGRRRLYAKLRAIHPPSPYTQVLTLAVIGRGSFPSLKVVCQPISDQKEDTTLDPILAVGWASPVGFQIVILLDTQGGGVLEGASPETLGGCLIVHCLFRERPGEGGRGVGLPLWGCCCSAAGQASGRKRSTVITRLTTISSSPWSGLLLRNLLTRSLLAQLVELGLELKVLQQVYG